MCIDDSPSLRIHSRAAAPQRLLRGVDRRSSVSGVENREISESSRDFRKHLNTKPVISSQCHRTSDSKSPAAGFMILLSCSLDYSNICGSACVDQLRSFSEDERRGKFPQKSTSSRNKRKTMEAEIKKKSLPCLLNVKDCAIKKLIVLSTALSSDMRFHV